MKLPQVFLFVLLLICTSALSGGEREFKLGEDSFRVFESEPAQIRMAWRDDREKPLLKMSAAYQQFAKVGKVEVEMLMNGGIFEPGQIPSGLYIESGKLLSALNLKNGEGNFFLKPNGVFFVQKEGAQFSAKVVSAREFAKLKPAQLAKIDYAVQSGPLLLNEGGIHAEFRRESKSKRLRNGIGIDAEGRVISLISTTTGGVNLWTFAECFRRLGCRDALYLDGSISRMESFPTKGVPGGDFATFIASVKLKGP